VYTLHVYAKKALVHQSTQGREAEVACVLINEQSSLHFALI